jgi:hypothetical protein
MLLATHIKDMSFEELLGVIKPFFYLVPLFTLIILGVIAYKIWQSLAVKRMLNYMETKGLNQVDKREYLKNYLTRTSQQDLIKHLRNCPVCGKKYSLKIQKVNSRGDMTEEWNHDGCTFCHTKVYTTNEVNHLKYLAIKRTPTNSPNEKKWQKVYTKLEEYIDYYKPFIDCTPDSSDNNITIDISLH